MYDKTKTINFAILLYPHKTNERWKRRWNNYD